MPNVGLYAHEKETEMMMCGGGGYLVKVFMKNNINKRLTI